MSLILGEVVRDYEKQCLYIVHGEFIKTMNDSNTAEEQPDASNISYTWVGKFLEERSIYFSCPGLISTVTFVSVGDQFYLSVDGKKYPIFNVCW